MFLLQIIGVLAPDLSPHATGSGLSQWPSYLLFLLATFGRNLCRLLWFFDL